MKTRKRCRFLFDSKNICTEEVLTCDAGVFLPVRSLEDAILQTRDGDDGDGEPVLREDHALGTRVGHVGGDGQEAGVVDTWTLQPQLQQPSDLATLVQHPCKVDMCPASQLQRVGGRGQGEEVVELFLVDPHAPALTDADNTEEVNVTLMSTDTETHHS